MFMNHIFEDGFFTMPSTKRNSISHIWRHYLNDGKHVVYRSDPLMLEPIGESCTWKNYVSSVRLIREMGFSYQGTRMHTTVFDKVLSMRPRDLDTNTFKIQIPTNGRTTKVLGVNVVEDNTLDRWSLNHIGVILATNSLRVIRIRFE